MRKGLSKMDVERILYEKIESEADLKYQIDDEYVLKALSLIIEGIADVVEENNRKLVDELLRR